MGKTNIIAGLSLQLDAQTAELKKELANTRKDISNYSKQTQTVGKQVQGAWLKMAGAIALVTGALKSADKVIKSNQTTSDKYDRIMAGVANTSKIVAQSIALADFDGLADRIKRAYTSGKQYAMIMDEIADRNRAVNVGWAKTEYLIKVQEGIMRDMSKDEGERLKAAQEIERLTTDQIDREGKLKQQMYDTQINKIKTTYKLTDDQANMVSQYVRDYDNLSDNQLKTVQQILAAEKEMERIKGSVGGGMISASKKSKKLIEAEEELKIQNQIKKQLSENEKAWYNLAVVLGGGDMSKFTDKMRDSLANADIDLYNFLSKMQMNLNKAQRGIGQNEDGLLIEINPVVDYDSIDDLLSDLENEIITNLTPVKVDLPFKYDEQFGAISEHILELETLKKTYTELGRSIEDSLKSGAKTWKDFGDVIKDTIQEAIMAKMALIMTDALTAAFGTAATTPFGLFLIPALTGLAIGGANTAINSIPGFTDGGIVPGTSYSGDRIPAFLNSGEMVLTTSQQGNLFRALSGGGAGQYEVIDFRIGLDALEGSISKIKNKNKAVYGF